MAHPFPLASVFTYGMRRDADRTMLPEGSVWNLVDFIPDEISAAAEGRGGWTYAGPTPTGSPSIIWNVAYHPDLGKVIATDGNTLWDAVAGSSYGTGFIGFASPPTYHRGYLIYGSRMNAGVAQAPAYLKDDGSVGTLSSAPKGVHTTTYKDHAVLARINTALNPSAAALSRVWFSAAGDPTTWDTTYGWWDTTGAVTGLASLTNCLLVFHSDHTERLRGTTPPPGSDMVLEPFLPNVGCIDSNSIAYWQQNAIFASSSGIYLTNGVSSVDLTAAAQMKTYWQSLMSGYATSWRIAAGVYREHYIISINNGSGLVDCLCVSLLNRTMWRFTNLRGASFVNVQVGQQEKCYMGQYNAGRIAEISSLWSPSSSVKQDGDGTNPTPIIETGAYRGYDRLHRRWIQSMGKQKWHYVYLDYDLRDSASDNPTISLSYATTPTGGYTAVTGGSIAKTTDYNRVRRGLNATLGGATRTDMLELKLAVNGPYARARVYTVEADFSPIDIGRL